MQGNIYIYILVMAAVTYAVRALPLTLIRKKITNRYIQSFLYYVPYATLAAMTFPAILYATGDMVSAACGFAAALFLAYKGKGLLPVAAGACAVVFAVQLAMSI
ncbi:AzlD domain-containing protein [Ruminococcus gauvreauii]|uniref:AzlD domain-containing protein n=1 Tax=Ruminococcus gauvreauii TaxID=438033 RepID=A0ABY5VE78_9FIRM|nr:AzlD domain-containing protein [Ruminococcus gauvreauii]UWP58855.1 AzlD domain-containing protein [Ruminococcus gauvreauii]